MISDAETIRLLKKRVKELTRERDRLKASLSVADEVITEYRKKEETSAKQSA